MTDNNVFPKARPLTETEFRQNWLVTLSRLCLKHGDDHIALWLGVTERHLRNVKSGDSLPSADKIWNLLHYDTTAHDELDKAYGFENVREGSHCSDDPLTLEVIALAHEVAEHESADSHGGTATTDHELRLKDEARLRRVYQTLGTWLTRLDSMRGVVRIPLKGKVA